MVIEARAGKIGPRNRIHLTNSILFGEHNGKPIPEEPSQQEKFISPPTFTPADTLYFAKLLTSSKSQSALRLVGVALLEQDGDDIQRVVDELKRRGVRSDEQFSEKGMPIIAHKVTAFAKLPLDRRLAVVEATDQMAVVLKPISHLSEKDLGCWHRIAHNDFVSMMRS